MSDKFDVMPRMARLDAIHADGVAIGRITRLTPIKIVHGKRSITGYLVQALSVGDGLLHGVLIVENLVPSHDGLHPARQTQPPEPIVENLIELQRGGRVVRDLHAGRQSVEYPVKLTSKLTARVTQADNLPISPQNWVALRRYQHPRLRVPENVVLLQDPLPPVEDADPPVPPVENLVAFEGGVRIGFDPHAGHRVVENLVLFQQPQAPVVDEHAPVLAPPDFVAADDGVAAGADLHARVQVVEDVVVFELAVAVVVEVHAHLLARVDAVAAEDGRAARGYPDARQGVGVHLVLLDEALALLVDVDAAVLAVVDFVVADDRVAVRADLDARQRVAWVPEMFENAREKEFKKTRQK